jgi:hypothetical protein
MTLRDVLGADVQRIHDQVDALLDREDGVVALFDGSRVLTYANGFGVSASQLEFLGVELERALHNVVGRSATSKGRRHREGIARDQRRDDVGRNRGGTAHGVLQLASKVA